MREIPARPGRVDYAFTDTTLWPGQTYQYRIEAVSPKTISATIDANGADVLPIQAAIILSSVILGLAAVYLLRQLAGTSLRASRMV